MAKLFGYAQVQDIQPLRANSGIDRIEAIIAGMTPAQRAADAGLRFGMGAEAPLVSVVAGLSVGVADLCGK
jgi:hypothetical protein